MERYETVFILTPVLSEGQAKEAVNSYKDLIKKNEGKLVHSEDWGLKKLAYPIQKKSTGFYHLLEFEAPGAFIGEMELQFRRDERIIRYMTVKMDKHHISFAESREGRKKSAKA